MNSLVFLAPLFGAGMGMAAAYGTTHSPMNKRIHFVERDNLESELEEFDVDFEETEVCGECGSRISPDEIGTIVKTDGDYKVICDDPECLDTYDVQ